MRLTQGAFSYLPPLTDDEIRVQVRHALGRGWVVSVELTDDPHPRNCYWELWGLPAFEGSSAEAVVAEVAHCRRAFPDHYVMVRAFDPSLGRQATALSFLVQRPDAEPGFRLERQEGPGRRVRYTVHAYAADRPHGERYAGR